MAELGHLQTSAAVAEMSALCAQAVFDEPKTDMLGAGAQLSSVAV